MTGWQSHFWFVVFYFQLVPLMSLHDSDSYVAKTHKHTHTHTHAHTHAHTHTCACMWNSFTPCASLDTTHLEVRWTEAMTIRLNKCRPILLTFDPAPSPPYPDHWQQQEIRDGRGTGETGMESDESCFKDVKKLCIWDSKQIYLSLCWIRYFMVAIPNGAT